MTTRKLTEKQRQAMEHLERARSEGMGLSAYASSHGLAVREIYDAIAALRRKGVLPPAAPRSKPRFVAVRVAPGAAGSREREAAAVARNAALCRVLIGGAVMIECAEWPPATWLAALVTERAGDAS